MASTGYEIDERAIRKATAVSRAKTLNGNQYGSYLSSGYALAA